MGCKSVKQKSGAFEDAKKRKVPQGKVIAKNTMDEMVTREESHLAQFCSILNNMHEGVIIKTAVENQILFANETACSILNNEDLLQQKLARVPGTDLNVKRFTAVDLQEGENPLLKDEVSGEAERTSTAKRVSLNSIVKGLQNDGDYAFSEGTIYKVSIPKK